MGAPNRDRALEPVARKPHSPVFDSAALSTDMARALAPRSNDCTKKNGRTHMKFVSAIIALIASASTALAADLPRRVETRAPAMVAAPAFNWTGLYLGAHVGGTFAADDFF